MVRFAHAVAFPPNCAGPKETVWFNVNKEKDSTSTQGRAWEYFQEVQRRYARQHMGEEFLGLPDGFGPLRRPAVNGKYFHRAAST